jgi:hypothetical protein
MSSDTMYRIEQTYKNLESLPEKISNSPESTRYTAQQARDLMQGLLADLNRLISDSNKFPFGQEGQVRALIDNIAEAQSAIEYEIALQSTPELHNESPIEHAARIYTKFNQLRLQGSYRQKTGQELRAMEARLGAQYNATGWKELAGTLKKWVAIDALLGALFTRVPWSPVAYGRIAGQAQMLSENNWPWAVSLLQEQAKTPDKENEKKAPDDTPLTVDPRIFLIDQKIGRSTNATIATRIRGVEKITSSERNKLTADQAILRDKLKKLHSYFFLSPHNLEGIRDGKLHAYRLWFVARNKKPNQYTKDDPQNRPDLFGDTDELLNPLAIKNGAFEVREFEISSLAVPVKNSVGDAAYKEFLHTWKSPASAWKEIGSGNVLYNTVFPEDPAGGANAKQLFIRPDNIARYAQQAQAGKTLQEIIS